MRKIEEEFREWAAKKGVQIEMRADELLASLKTSRQRLAIVCFVGGATVGYMLGVLLTCAVR